MRRGFAYAKIAFANLASPARRQETDLVVDTGALYSIIPASLLRGLGIEPHTKMEFEIADGSTIQRQVGDARFFYDGRTGASPVIFGKEGDAGVLGVVTLEAWGLEVDPIRKRIRPAKLILY